MAPPVVKSSLRSIAALLRRGRDPATARSYHATHYDEAREAEKWEKISIAGIITCAVLSIYILRKGHHEYPEPPPYPYLRIQNKEFPWGPEPLIEHIKKKKQQQHQHPEHKN